MKDLHPLMYRNFINSKKMSSEEAVLIIQAFYRSFVTKNLKTL